MEQQGFNSKQAFCLITLFLFGTTLLIEGDRRAGHDSWISLLIAIGGGILCALLYGRILKLFPGENLYSILQSVFGKVIGWVIILVYTLYFFHLAVLVVNDFCEFVHLVSLPHTPQIVNALLLSLLCAWTVSAGPERMGRAAVLLFGVAVIGILLTVFMSVGDMQWDNLFPVAVQGMQPILDASWTMFVFPFGETVVFLLLLGQMHGAKKPAKTLVWAMVFAGVILLLDLLRDILVLGGNTFSELYYPTYNAISMININDFIQRIEALVSGVFITGVFIKVSVCLYGASVGFQHLIRRGSLRLYAFPLAVIAAFLSVNIFPNAMASFAWIYVYRLYSPIVQVGLPLLLWPVAELVCWRRRKHPPAPKTGPAPQE